MIFYSTQKRDAYMSRMGDRDTTCHWRSRCQGQPILTSPKLAGFTFPTLVIDGRYDMNVAPLRPLAGACHPRREGRLL